ncbi:glycoside hydrolase family 16 protein [Epithele typhae]|uniref:glycoside hydrolase family 16 protein n=1 Tax=Epithele typhae TaxID=378194 RepID=UPI002008363B|nr:glycoside hydrolase family 16 protein [Epithele typhae]KAH9944099.1 glycoside hydrolase family 16 protein [Epithele typhae]
MDPRYPYESITPSTSTRLLPGTQGSLRASPSRQSLRSESRYGESGLDSMNTSLAEKYSLSPDPSSWGADVSFNHPEDDDSLHNPNPKRDHRADKGGSVFTARGLMNLGCILFLATAILMLFAGYPVLSYFLRTPLSTQGGFNLGGTNASGQVPDLSGNWGLIDIETPQEWHSYKDFRTNKDWQLVFSDEFNTDGRSFYPGDDPYWEAVDLHYWATNNLEWYDPKAITTKNGSLEITLSAEPNHGLDYTGGMMSTWNKFCFTGGLVLASVVLPGSNNILGLWPAIWQMGNLGRAGYGATLEGMWPYSYDSCDVGTVKNQTLSGLPIAATNTGVDDKTDFALSYLPGQRLSRCTCQGESHPGPIHSDGTYVGRSAPEIDMFEAQISNFPTGDDPLTGQVSQSGQWAPFNEHYEWFNTTDNLVIANASASLANTYTGGVFQQASSVVTITITDQEAYELTGNNIPPMAFSTSLGSMALKEAWTLNQAGFAADTRVEIGPRPVPQEPMYLIMNLGMSFNFGTVDLQHITFPTKMKVDWIRVYQDPSNVNIGCDPPDFPTSDYINTYMEAYTNPNLTTWVDDFNQTFPKNSFLGEC